MGPAKVPVGGGMAGRGAGRRRQGQGGPRDEANRPQHNRPHWCGGYRRDRRARLRCPWAVAGPGRASRRGESSSAQQAPLVWRAPERPENLAAVPVGGGRARARCWSAAAGPGRASRSTTPSEARVWRSRGRAAADQHTQRPGPSRQATRRSKISRALRYPEHRWHHKQHDAPAHAKTPPRGCGTGFSLPSRV